MPIHYVCEPKLNRPVESERSSPTEFKLQSYVLWTLTLEKRHHPPPTILLSTIQSRASFRLRLSGRRGNRFRVIYLPTIDTRAASTDMHIEGGRNRGRRNSTGGSQIGKSSKYCARSWFIVNVSVYSCETNQSRRGRPTKRKQYAKSDKDIYTYICIRIYNNQRRCCQRRAT